MLISPCKGYISARPNWKICPSKSGRLFMQVLTCESRKRNGKQVKSDRR
nr:MAG TPA_asm: hypothetical protein [Caudoviricetes sp.]